MPPSSPLPLSEHELKFHVPSHRTPGLRQWLNQAFRPHPRHAVSMICSIYFDTPEGLSMREKVQSDYFKTKYRVRWYADELGRHLPLPAFIEIKEKHGAVRRKYRAPLPQAPSELAAVPLEDALFTGLFQAHLPASAPKPPANLLPLMELNYIRHRYQHHAFTEAFCLDSNIRCVRTRAGRLPPGHSTPLAHDVFEQKGLAQNPVPPLQALPRFDVQRASVSKFYEARRQLLPDHD